MYIMWMVMLSLSVIELVVSATGFVRLRSPSRRFVFDANNKFTGWASWEHHAACSIRCVSGYETETKQCCETGDNRLCYSLPWNMLKMYIGTCRTTASSTAKPSTEKISTTKSPTATTQFSTTMKTSTRPTRLTTNIQLPKTIRPVTTICAVCAGPKFLCERLYEENACSPPNNYCINIITNHRDGTREEERACGNFDTCYRDWYQDSSDSDLCQQFDESNYLRLDFKCTYCCIKDNCNIPVHPSDNTLYTS